MTLPDITDYTALGALAPEPDDGEPRPLPGQMSIDDALEDMEPPEPVDPSSDAAFEATRAYYDGPAGTPCPACGGPKPDHEPGCWEAPEGEPAYRVTPADYEPGGRRA